LWAAVIGAGAALVSSGIVLLFAASVLVSEAPSIQRLADTDKADGGAFPGPRVTEPESPLMKYLLIERRLELLGPRLDSVWGLIAWNSAAHDGIAHNRTVTIDGRTYSPATNEADAHALLDVASELQRRIQAVLSAADRWTVKERFLRLQHSLVVCGLILLGGLSLYVTLIAQAEPRTKVTEATPATVLVPANARAARDAGFDAGCAGKSLEGVLIAGWLDKPLLVTKPTPDCPSQRIRPGRQAAVIPVVPSS
jgi:hypothetical protein